MKITQARLLQLFNYDPKTGHLFWKIRPRNEFKTEGAFKTWNTRYANKIAGGLSSDGYIQVQVDKKRYRAHRLAYLIYHGYMPENDVDHKDRIRHHNWIDNLREVSRQCNMRNLNVHKRNKSEVTGVYFSKTSEKWVAQITISQKATNLGVREDKADAVMLRWEAEKKYKFPNCCTSSSAYNYLKSNGLI